ncbi:hypothetical protein [Evansella cellulosilytica]|uniref:hypothetical protein n=1 Tax=Evansella cellulosilytica TaxID=1413 RepID=UPI0001C289D8|nr:hypothetical protein [Evansella cellulosilytica]
MFFHPMDFWVSLEHKIFYKYNRFIPEHLEKELMDAAISASQLDKKWKPFIKKCPN